MNKNVSSRLFVVYEDKSDIDITVVTPRGFEPLKPP
jgi:hypothetical protein